MTPGANTLAAEVNGGMTNETATDLRGTGDGGPWVKQPAGYAATEEGGSPRPPPPSPPRPLGDGNPNVVLAAGSGLGERGGSGVGADVGRVGAVSSKVLRDTVAGPQQTTDYAWGGDGTAARSYPARAPELESSVESGVEVEEEDEDARDLRVALQEEEDEDERNLRVALEEEEEEEDEDERDLRVALEEEKRYFDGLNGGNGALDASIGHSPNGVRAQPAKVGAGDPDTGVPQTGELLAPAARVGTEANVDDNAGGGDVGDDEVDEELARVLEQSRLEAEEQMSLRTEEEEGEEEMMARVMEESRQEQERRNMEQLELQRVRRQNDVFVFYLPVLFGRVGLGVGRYPLP